MDNKGIPPLKWDLNQLGRETENTYLESIPTSTPEYYENPSQYDSGISLKDKSSYDSLMGYRADQQGFTNGLATFTGRFVGQTATKFGEGVGMALGALPAILSGDINKMTDNFMVNWFEETENKLKENLPWYEEYTKRYQDKSPWTKIFTPTYWNTQGVDGMAFMASAWLEGGLVGGAIKGLGIGTKILEGVAEADDFFKLGKAFKKGVEASRRGTAMANIPTSAQFWGSVGASATTEAAFEARGVQKEFEQKYKPIVDKQLMDAEAMMQKELNALETFAIPPTPMYSNEGQFLGMQDNTAIQKEQLKQDILNRYQQKVNQISDDFKQKSQNAGWGTFRSNLPMLMISNAVELGSLFGTYKGVRKAVEVGSKAAKAKAVGSTLMELGKQSLTEGSEEIQQLAISDYYTDKALGTENRSWVEGVVSNYFKNFTTTEGVENFLGGAVTGLLPGAIGGYRKARAEQRHEDNLSTVLADNMVAHRARLEDLYEKNEDGSVKTDSKGTPIIDKVKLTELGIDNLGRIFENEKLDKLAEIGDKEGWKFARAKKFATFAIPYLREGGTTEILEKHIDELAKAETEDNEKVKDTDSNGNVQSPQQIAAEYKAMAKEFQKVWDSVNERHAGVVDALLDIKRRDFSSNEKYQNALKSKQSFIDNLISSQYYEGTKQHILKKQLLDVKSQINLIFANNATSVENILNGVSALNGVDKEQYDKLSKAEKELTATLEESYKNFEILANRKGQIKAFRDKLIKDNEIRKTTKDIENDKENETKKNNNTDEANNWLDNVAGGYEHFDIEDEGKPTVVGKTYNGNEVRYDQDEEGTPHEIVRDKKNKNKYTAVPIPTEKHNEIQDVIENTGGVKARVKLKDANTFQEVNEFGDPVSDREFSVDDYHNKVVKGHTKEDVRRDQAKKKVELQIEAINNSIQNRRNTIDNLNKDIEVSFKQEMDALVKLEKDLLKEINENTSQKDIDGIRESINDEFDALIARYENKKEQIDAIIESTKSEITILESSVKAHKLLQAKIDSLDENNFTATAYETYLDEVEDLNKELDSLNLLRGIKLEPFTAILTEAGLLNKELQNKINSLEKSVEGINTKLDEIEAILNGMRGAMRKDTAPWLHEKARLGKVKQEAIEEIRELLRQVDNTAITTHTTNLNTAIDEIQNNYIELLNKYRFNIIKKEEDNYVPTKHQSGLDAVQGVTMDKKENEAFKTPTHQDIFHTTSMIDDSGNETLSQLRWGMFTSIFSDKKYPKTKLQVIKPNTNTNKDNNSYGIFINDDRYFTDNETLFVVAVNSEGKPIGIDGKVTDDVDKMLYTALLDSESNMRNITSVSQESKDSYKEFKTKLNEDVYINKKDIYLTIKGTTKGRQAWDKNTTDTNNSVKGRVWKSIPDNANGIIRVATTTIHGEKLGSITIVTEAGNEVQGISRKILLEEANTIVGLLRIVARNVLSQGSYDKAFDFTQGKDTYDISRQLKDMIYFGLFTNKTLRNIAVNKAIGFYKGYLYYGDINSTAMLNSKVPIEKQLNRISLEDLYEGKNTEALKEFLANLYHNINNIELKANKTEKFVAISSVNFEINLETEEETIEIKPSKTYKSYGHYLLDGINPPLGTNARTMFGIEQPTSYLQLPFKNRHLVFDNDYNTKATKTKTKKEEIKTTATPKVTEDGKYEIIYTKNGVKNTKVFELQMINGIPQFVDLKDYRVIEEGVAQDFFDILSGKKETSDKIQIHKINKVEDNTSGNYNIIASDYLLTGGLNVIGSSDYFLQALIGTFPKAKIALNKIRDKYSKEINDTYGNLSEFVASDLYKQVIAEITDAVNNTYDDDRVNEILEEILKYPAGLPVKIGNQLSIEMDKFNSIEEETTTTEEEPLTPMSPEELLAAEFGIETEETTTKEEIPEEVNEETTTFLGKKVNLNPLTEEEKQQNREKFGESNFSFKDDEVPYRKAELRTSEEIENFEKFKQWAEKNLPKEISLRIQKGLIDGDALGMYYKHIITLTDSAEVGTGYHEAFHVVSLSLLTKEERKEIYDEYRAKYNQPKLTDKQVEEKLAEGFREYMLANNKQSLLSKWGKKVISYFKRLFGVVEGFTELEQSPDKIQELYYHISKGKFRDAKIIDQYDEQVRKSSVLKDLPLSISTDMIKSLNFHALVMYGTKAGINLNKVYLDKVRDFNINPTLFDEAYELGLASIAKDTTVIALKKYIEANKTNIIKVAKQELKFSMIKVREDNSTLEEVKKKDTLYDKDATKVNPSEEIFPAIKFALQFIPTGYKNSLGLHKFYEYEEIRKTLLKELVGTTTLEEIVNKLDSIKTKYPFIKNVITKFKLNSLDKLSNDDFYLVKQFAQSFNKARLKSVTAIYGDNGMYIVDSNSENMATDLVNAWRIHSLELAHNNSGALIMINNEPRFNKPKLMQYVKEVSGDYIVNTTGGKRNNAVKLLSDIGINIDEEKLTSENEAKLYNFINFTIKDIVNKEKTVADFYRDKSTGIKGIAYNNLDVEGLLQADAQYRGADGQTRYEIVEHNELTILTSALKFYDTLEDLLEFHPELSRLNPKNNFAISESPLFKNLFTYDEDSDTYKINKNVDFGVVLLGGSKVGESNSTGDNTSDLTPGDLIVLRIFSVISGTSPFIRSSDKKNEYALTMPYHSGKLNREDYNYENSEEVIENLLGLYAGEVYQQAVLTDKTKWKKKHGEDSVFSIIVGGNPILSKFQLDVSTKENKEEIIQAIKNEYTNNSVYARAFRGAMEKFFDAEVEIMKSNLISQGVLKYSLDSKGQYDNIGLTIPKIGGIAGFKRIKNFSEKDLTNILYYLVTNDFIYNYEQTMFFTGNLVHYKNSADIIKRTSAPIATKQYPTYDKTTMQMMNDKFARTDGKVVDGNVKIVISKDIMHKVEELGEENLEQMLYERYHNDGMSESSARDIAKTEADIYREITETDGIQILNLDYFREWHIALGKWNDTFEKSFQYYVALGEIYKNNKSVSVIKEEISKLEKPVNLIPFPSRKPQQFGQVRDANMDSHGTYVPFFGKCSFEVVLPHTQYMVVGDTVEQTTLGKLHDWMQTNQIDIYAFDSTAKDDYFTNDGMAPNLYDVATNLETKVSGLNILYGSNIGNQVETNEFQHESATLGSQHQSLKYSDFYENGVDEGVTIETEDGTKKVALGQILDDMSNNFFSAKKAELLNKLNIVKVGDEYKVENYKVFIKKLEAELNSRDISQDVIDSLNLLGESTPMGNKYPINILLDAEKVEPILLSILTKTIRPKVLGTMAFQVPSSGWTVSKEQVKGSNELKFYEARKIGDSVFSSPMEVITTLPVELQKIVEFYFNNNLDEFNVYVAKNPELFTITAFRTPTSGPNSIDAVVVKRFTDPALGDQLVLPSAIVAKSGTDYDIDKMTLYFYKWVYDTETKELKALKDGNSENTDLIQNAIIDLQNKVTLSPENRFALLSPISTDKLKKLSNSLQKNKKKDTPLAKILTTSYLLNISIQFWSSKSLVGMQAVHNTSHQKALKSGLGVAENMGEVSNILSSTNIDSDLNNSTKVFFDGSVSIGDKKVTLIRSFSLALTKDTENYRISKTLNEQINAIIDAAKDPFIFEMGITEQTIAVSNYLYRRGLSPKQVGLFLKQPIIIEYLNMLSKNKSQFLKSYNEVNDNFFEGKKTFVKALSKKYIGAKIDAQTPLVVNTEHIFTNKELETMKDIKVENLNFDQRNQQIQLLRDFIRYDEQARLLGELIKASASDRKGAGTNWAENLMLKQTYEEIKKKNIFTSSISKDSGVDVYMDKNLKVTHEIAHNAENYFEGLEIRFNEFSRILLAPIERYFSDKRTSSKEDKEKIYRDLDRFLQAYLFNMIKTTFNSDEVVEGVPVSTALADEFARLFKGNNPIYKRIEQSKKVITDNLFLNNLISYSTEENRKDHFINIGISNKKINPEQLQAYKDNIDELFETNPKLVKDIFFVQLLQSGIKNSPISFLNLFPSKIKTIFAVQIYENYLDNPKSRRDMSPEHFKDTFFANNIYNNDIVPKVTIRENNASAKITDNKLTITQDNFNFDRDYLKTYQKVSGEWKVRLWKVEIEEEGYKVYTEINPMGKGYRSTEIHVGRNSYHKTNNSVKFAEDKSQVGLNDLDVDTFKDEEAQEPDVDESASTKAVPSQLQINFSSLKTKLNKEMSPADNTITLTNSTTEQRVIINNTIDEVFPGAKLSKVKSVEHHGVIDTYFRIVKQDGSFVSFDEYNGIAVPSTTEKVTGDKSTAAIDAYFKDKTQIEAVEMLTTMKENGSTDFHKSLAAKLSKLDFNMVDVKLMSDEEINAIPNRLGLKKVGGLYVSVTNDIDKFGTIYINKDVFKGHTQKTIEQTILHEMFHALLVNRLQEDSTFNKRITALMEYARDNGVDATLYGMNNVDEFMSEAFSNPEFQSILVAIPSAYGKASLLHDLMEYVRDLVVKLGIVNKEDATLLDDIFLETNVEIGNDFVLDTTKIDSLGKDVTVAKYMKTLTKEEREYLRKLINSGIVKFKCK